MPADTECEEHIPRRRGAMEPQGFTKACASKCEGAYWSAPRVLRKKSGSGDGEVAAAHVVYIACSSGRWVTISCVVLRLATRPVRPSSSSVTLSANCKAVECSARSDRLSMKAPARASGASFCSMRRQRVNGNNAEWAALRRDQSSRGTTCCCAARRERREQTCRQSEPRLRTNRDGARDSGGSSSTRARRRIRSGGARGGGAAHPTCGKGRHHNPQKAFAQSERSLRAKKLGEQKHQKPAQSQTHHQNGQERKSSVPSPDTSRARMRSLPGARSAPGREPSRTSKPPHGQPKRTRTTTSQRQCSPRTKQTPRQKRDKRASQEPQTTAKKGAGPHTHPHTPTHTHTHTPTPTYKHTHTHPHKPTHTHPHPHTHTPTHTHTHPHTHKHTNTHPQTHTHTHPHIPTSPHTPTHPHTPPHTPTHPHTPPHTPTPHTPGRPQVNPRAHSGDSLMQESRARSESERSPESKPLHGARRRPPLTLRIKTLSHPI